jgi:hypothetical protein
MCVYTHTRAYAKAPPHIFPAVASSSCGFEEDEWVRLAAMISQRHIKCGSAFVKDSPDRRPITCRVVLRKGGERKGRERDRETETEIKTETEKPRWRNRGRGREREREESS